MVGTRYILVLLAKRSLFLASRMRREEEPPDCAKAGGGISTLC